MGHLAARAKLCSALVNIHLGHTAIIGTADFKPPGVTVKCVTFDSVLDGMTWQA